MIGLLEWSWKLCVWNVLSSICNPHAIVFINLSLILDISNIGTSFCSCYFSCTRTLHDSRKFFRIACSDCSRKLYGYSIIWILYKLQTPVFLVFFIYVYLKCKLILLGWIWQSWFAHWSSIYWETLVRSLIDFHSLCNAGAII